MQLHTKNAPWTLALTQPRGRVVSLLAIPTQHGLRNAAARIPRRASQAPSYRSLGQAASHRSKTISLTPVTVLRTLTLSELPEADLCPPHCSTTAALWRPKQELVVRYRQPLAGRPSAPP